jgi:hypothetical protein
MSMSDAQRDSISPTDILLPVLLAGGCLALYARTWGFAYLHFDDQQYVFQNPRTLSGLSAATVVWAFTTTEFANWHPLTWLSYLLDVTIMGKAHPGQMHLVNALFHAMNAALVYALVRALGCDWWRAGFAGAFFAFHPLRVESVAWVSERKDVLSAFFGLIAVMAYLAFGRTRRWEWFVSSCVAMALSLMAKPMLVTLPFLLLVLDVWPLRRLDRATVARRVVEKLPMFVMSAGSCWITWYAQKSSGAMEFLKESPIGFRLLNAVLSYGLYLRDHFIPGALSPLYPMSGELYLGPVLLAGGSLIVVTAVLIVIAYRRTGGPLAGWAWFVGTLVPVIGLVAIGEHSRADRYTYFPGIGLCIALACLLPGFRLPAARLSLGIVLTAWIGFLMWRSHAQVGYWKNDETLFGHAISVVGPHPSLLVNYAIGVSAGGDHEKAVSLYDEALKSRPYWGLAWTNRGNALLRMQRTTEAIESYRESISRDPKWGSAFYNLGTTLAKAGELEEAEKLLREALRLQPDNAGARNNLNNVLRLQGRAPEP